MLLEKDGQGDKYGIVRSVIQRTGIIQRIRGAVQNFAGLYHPAWLDQESGAFV